MSGQGGPGFPVGDVELLGGGVNFRHRHILILD